MSVVGTWISGDSVCGTSGDSAGLQRARLSQTFKPDFVCFDKIILEIKAVSKLTDEHRAQVHNYLKATGRKLGLLVNFGHHPNVEWERIVR